MKKVMYNKKSCFIYKNSDSLLQNYSTTQKWGEKMEFAVP